jgi:hypothetical protein
MCAQNRGEMCQFLWNSEIHGKALNLYTIKYEIFLTYMESLLGGASRYRVGVAYQITCGNGESCYPLRLQVGWLQLTRFA